uniref:Uncharacterized protein n=1 Tax=Candidatus Kentrum sp. FM TaxID=2126340 RepID=A0A450WZS8_9GAMM|nr:MAG: hypothetical protein BECKFM1743B_GA0114221_108664 [Candidatus Kentron sp. FM]
MPDLPSPNENIRPYSSYHGQAREIHGRLLHEVRLAPDFGPEPARLEYDGVGVDIETAGDLQKGIRPDGETFLHLVTRSFRILSQPPARGNRIKQSKHRHHHITRRALTGLIGRHHRLARLRLRPTRHDPALVKHP